MPARSCQRYLFELICRSAISEQLIASAVFPARQFWQLQNLIGEMIVVAGRKK
jgi:hypothetical protein